MGVFHSDASNILAPRKRVLFAGSLTVPLFLGEAMPEGR